MATTTSESIKRAERLTGLSEQEGRPVGNHVMRTRYPQILPQHTFMARCSQGVQTWLCYAESNQSTPLCPECGEPMEVITEMNT
jgi:hypothetical protein